MPALPIACRRFSINKDGGEYLDVMIFLPTKDHDDYRCRYELRSGDLIVKESHAMGVDSLQAVILAIKKASVDIAFSNEGKNRTLYWNDQNHDLGLIF